MKDYRYNYGFIKEWMAVNDKRQKDVLAALESKDYTSLHRWIEGLSAMPVETMVRFCNAFNVPIHAFFFDNESSGGEQEPKKPDDDSQTEPTGGFRERVTGVVGGGRGITTPIPPFHENTITPGTPDILSAPVTDDVRILKLQLAHQREINELKEKYRMQESKTRSHYEARLRQKDERIDDILRTHKEQVEFIHKLVAMSTADKPKEQTAKTPKFKKPRIVEPPTPTYNNTWMAAENIVEPNED